MKEIWKDVIGFEGSYQVSNMGNIKSLEREIKHFRGGLMTLKERILNPCANSKGYSIAILSKENKRHVKSMHRLVASAFIHNHENKITVNHKNGIKNDNRLINLEWATVSENVKHAYDSKLKYPYQKKISQFTLDGQYIKSFDSIIQVQRELGINGSHISSVCKGKRKTTGGYIWKYNN
jgi:hypothetical protein